MKRIIAIITCGIFFCYFLMAIYHISPPYVRKSYVGKVAAYTKHILGIGVLFDRKASAISKSASYRFYQNGKWGQKELLLEPLFEDYKRSGNIAALKHCRLDWYLAFDVNRVYRQKGITKMKQSKEYNEFLNHLFYRHNNNIKPDSLEIFYYIRNPETDRLRLALNFKSKT